MRLLFSSSLLFLTAITQALAFSNPEACSGACGYVHDPYVVKRSDGTYFRFVTFDEIQIATAPSLDGPWTEQGPALPGGSEIALPGNMSLWVCYSYLHIGLFATLIALKSSSSTSTELFIHKELTFL